MLSLDRSPRIAIAYDGDPTDPTEWSGIPFSIGQGLTRVGAEVVPLCVRPPHSLRRAVELALSIPRLPVGRGSLSEARALSHLGIGMSRVRSGAARLTLSQLGALDGVVQVGSSFSLPTGTRYVTFEDMTIAQVSTEQTKRFYPPWDRAPARMVSHLRDRQAAVYGGAVTCVAATHWAAGSIRSDYGVPPGRVAVAGLGGQVRADAPERGWWPPRFLFVGLDWERKNGPGVLRAFHAVRRTVPGARLDVVGRHPRIDADGIVGHGVLRFSEPSEAAALKARYEAATCFVMPSHHEAAGMVYVEAGAAGLPSIGTLNGGAATMVGDGGRLVDPSDEVSIAAAMLELSDGATAARLGTEALAHAARFTWDLVAQRILRALELPNVDSSDLATYLPQESGRAPS